MVAITPEEVMEMRKSRRTLDEMSELDRTIAGHTAKHLVVPMCDVFNLRRIAGILHGLAADLDHLSRRGDLRARSIILETRDAIDQANSRIREMTGKGKTPKAYGGLTQKIT